MQSVQQRCPKQQLPDDYLVIDVETSGLHPGNDCIIQVGICPVRGRQPGDWHGIYVQRPGLKLNPKVIEVTGITEKDLAEKGVPAKMVFAEVFDLFSWYRDKGFMFVGHNVAGFDCPFFENDLLRNGFKWKFDHSEIIDTGGLVKGAQLETRFREKESLRDYWMRIRNIRARGVFWALDRYCIPTFKLDQKYGVDTKQAHDAGYDCWVTHLLFEEFRTMHERVADATHT